MMTRRELNKSLIENQKQWKERVHHLEEQNRRVEQDTALRVADLEGQVRVCRLVKVDPLRWLTRSNVLVLCSVTGPRPHVLPGHAE